MATDLKSLKHLRAHRRSRCHNADRGQTLSWNPPSSLHTLAALDKAYDSHAPWHDHLSKIQYSYACDCHDSSSPRTNPVLLESRIPIILTKP
ncbi:UNVERIFIED_CONTAM: hypothetical protein Sangu_3097800 [Sesamum angustifolium]|uniref:Uncharacterized protein n=1 Tax=Sesamum angustifolium TaxID=2727405 RepID=A0AAW2K6M3_9LAMI